MRLDNMIEVVRQSFPQISRTQIIFDLNHEMVNFAQKTKVLYGRDVLTRTVDLISEDWVAGTTTWTLPANCYELTTVEQVAAEDWYVSGQTLVVRWCDTGVDGLDLEFSRYPMAIALDSDEPEFESQFHYGMVYRLLGNYAVRYGKDSASANYFHAAAKSIEVEAKRYGLTRNTRNPNPSKGGVLLKTAFISGKTLTAGENTITMNVTFSTIDSYAILLNGNGIEVEEFDPNLNHDQRTTSTFKVMSAADNTRFDYIVTGS
jgi:hypothetical protein